MWQHDQYSQQIHPQIHFARFWDVRQPASNRTADDGGCGSGSGDVEQNGLRMIVDYSLHKPLGDSMIYLLRVLNVLLFIMHYIYS